MSQFAMDAEGVAILPLYTAEESDSSEVVHTFSGLGLAVAAEATPPVGPAAAPPMTSTKMAAAGLTAAVPPPELQAEEAPLGDAGGSPTSADLEQGGELQAPALPFLLPDALAAGGHVAGSGAPDTAFGAPTTTYIPYVTPPPPPPSAWRQGTLQSLPPVGYPRR